MLDFKEVARQITFEALLNHLNEPYETRGKSLITKDAFISLEKQMFFWKENKKGGNVIQYAADVRQTTNLEAARWLSKTFLKNEIPEREIPELELRYSKEVEALNISEETAKNFEIGLPKGKTVMAGKVCFRCYDKSGAPIGYVGLKDGKWFYPKGFRASEHLYNYNRRNGNQFCVLVSSPLEVAKLFQDGKPQAVGLFSPSLSEAQNELLKTFRYIYLIHPKPENILTRLAKTNYVKYA